MDTSTSTMEQEEESNNFDTENIGEILTRIELDLARSAEKLTNLNSLVMNVATREGDFETFLSDKDPSLSDSSQKALEFDLLSGILDSNAKELEDFISTHQMDIECAREALTSHNQQLGEAYNVIEEKLDDCEKTLNQSLEQLSEIKVQSSNFQRIISISGKNDEPVECFGNGYLSNLDNKIKMQTSEQQRHILRMLEKSLARELDLEKKLNESKLNEEILNRKLKEEIFFHEEESEASWERLFKADNLAEVLLSSSKELLGRLQVSQFTQKGSSNREEDSRSKLQEHEKTILDLKEKVKSLEDNEFLSSKVTELEKRSENAEKECKLLREFNMDLETELEDLKVSNINALDKNEQLEKQLKEADIGLQHAVASAEATQEKLPMLHSTIKDMENLINNLKSNIAKAESQTESVEDKCIQLSETNADLSNEVNFLRARLECLEGSLNQAEVIKKETAKEISTRTKLIFDLIVQLASERERLHNQIYSLTKDKRDMINYTRKMNKDQESTTENVLFKNDVSGSGTASVKGSNDDLTHLPSTSSEGSRNVLEDESVRNIDARQLNIKYLVFPVFLLMTLFAAFWVQNQGYVVLN